MSRKYETREIKYNTEQLETVTCDLCGAEHFSQDWGWGGSTVDEITISRKMGSEYPEGGHGTTGTFDVCPKCWETKLVPWFESQGAHCQTKDWDY